MKLPLPFDNTLACPMMFRTASVERIQGSSIVDLHGDHLADARNKLALAEFAEQHGDSFVRLESITKIGEALRYLDLGEGAVRDEVRSFDGAEVAALYSGEGSAQHVTG